MAGFVVAGATGRVGSTVASELLAGGARTTVIVRSDRARRAWEARGATVVMGSLDDRAFLTGTLREAEGFFTLLPENVSPDDFHGNRRRMAEATAAAIHDSHVPHVAFLSAIAAVLPDGNGPAKDLHYCERLLAGTGPALTIFRACYFQDNVASVLPAATSLGIYPHFMPSADAEFPMVAARDVGQFAAAALLHPPARTERVIVAGPHYSMRQVADRLGVAIGKRLHVVDVPPAQHVSALVDAGVPAPIAAAVAEMFSAFAKGLIVPEGDRQLTGSTAIDEVIADCLRRRAADA